MNCPYEFQKEVYLARNPNLLIFTFGRAVHLSSKTKLSTKLGV